MKPLPDSVFQALVNKQFEEGDRRMNGLTADVAQVKQQLNENTAATARVEANTAEMLAVFESWRGAMRALEMIGRLAKPLGYILGAVAALASVWAAAKGGGSPK